MICAGISQGINCKYVKQIAIINVKDDPDSRDSSDGIRDHCNSSQSPFNGDYGRDDGDRLDLTDYQWDVIV